MGMRTASGASTAPGTAAAVPQALKLAQKGLGDAARLGFVFASPKYDTTEALQIAKKSSPSTTFVACSTSGEITERGPTRGGVSVLLLGGDGFDFDVRTHAGIDADPAKSADVLCAGFDAIAQRATRAGLPRASTILLIDGVARTFETLVNEVRRATRPYQQIVGGGAGDDLAVKATFVGRDDRVVANGALAVHLFAAKGLGVGVEHGMLPATPKMTVTRSTGPLLHEIDGRPAFEAYRAYAAGRGLSLEPDHLRQLLVQNEIGVYFLDGVCKVRAPFDVTPDGTLVCGASVPQGSSVSIVTGKPVDLIAAAKRAAEEAAASLDGAEAAGVLVFSCVCRGMQLDRQYGEEISAIRSVFPGVPMAGMLSYGEIARFKGKLDGVHNSTVVVVAIPK
jgi:methyl-accepting chemotaxis protein